MKHQSGTDSRRETQFPVDLARPLALEIRNPVGDVSIRAVERADVLISYGCPGFAGIPGDDERGPTIDAHDNRIEIRANPRLDVGWAGVAGDIDLETLVGQVTKAFRFGGAPFSARRGKAHGGSGSRVWADIAVEVPRSMDSRVEVNCVSGEAHVAGLSGEIALTTMSGDVRVMRTTGVLTVQSASGDLLVEEASGHFTARAASGDIRVAAAQLEEFQIQTASGDVYLDAALAGDGPFRAQTASGDVRLTLRRPAAEGEEPAATLAFHTVSGDAHVTPPFRETARGRWQSDPGNGGPLIDITTVNGDLSATIAATKSAFVPDPSPAAFVDDAPTPPVPPMPTPAAASDRPRGEHEPAGAVARPDTGQSTAPDDPTRLAVLEAVERGEIDVEEALRRLDTADAGANP